MSYLQQLQLVERLRTQISDRNTLSTLNELERVITRADERASEARRRMIWARCWISDSPAGPRPIWQPLDEELGVTELVSGDPDNLDRLCSEIVVAAESLLEEQPPDIQAVRLRIMLNTHDSAGRGHNLTLDYVSRRLKQPRRRITQLSPHVEPDPEQTPVP